MVISLSHIKFDSHVCIFPSSIIKSNTSKTKSTSFVIKRPRTIYCKLRFFFFFFGLIFFKEKGKRNFIKEIKTNTIKIHHPNQWVVLPPIHQCLQINLLFQLNYELTYSLPDEHAKTYNIPNYAQSSLFLQ